MTDNEQNRLASIAEDSWYAQGATGASIQYSAKILSRFFLQSSCLELGPAEGLMTAVLTKHFEDLTCVDGAPSFCEHLSKTFPSIKVMCSLFEEFEPDKTFDTIVLGHVLEHVISPMDILRKIKQWLTPTGRVIATVPNAWSLHRQIAVEMGILASEHTLNATDLHHGHRRVYDPISLREEFRHAGFNIEAFGGYWLKPVSNRQIEEDWTPDMLEGAMRVGERYPDIAAEIYIVAS